MLPGGQHKKLRRTIDIVAVVALVLLALFVVLDERNPYDKNWEIDTFYQRYYATVVMSVCGQGWHSVEPVEDSALDRFLQLESDSFSCRQLSADLQKLPPNFMAVAQLYLFKTVEWTWTLSEKISWTGLRPLFALICALVSAVSYGIFRLGMSPALAFPGALAFFTYHLPMAPYLRDYAKAPFILASILLMGLMVRGSFSSRRLLILTTAAGLVVGVGLGFRPDLLIVAPLMVMAIALFLPGRLSHNLSTKLLAILLFLVLMIAAYSPIWTQEAGRHGTAHVILLGFTNRLTDGLGLQPSLYEWEHIFSDSWVDFQVRSFAFFGLGVVDPVPMYSESYEHFGMQAVFDRYAHYPADTLMRAYAAVLHFVPMPAVFGLVILAFSVVSKRQALFLLLITLYFTGYPSIQFDLRHYFQLEFVPLWLLGFAIQGGVVLAWRARGSLAAEGWKQSCQRWAKWARGPVLKVLVAGGLVPIALLVPLMLARTHQNTEVTAILERYEVAQLETLISEETPIESLRLIRLTPSGLLEPLPNESEKRHAVGYLVVEVARAGCDAESATFSTIYEAGSFKDFSHTFRIDIPAAGSTKVFAPIYSRIQSDWPDSPFRPISPSGQIKNVYLEGFSRHRFLGVDIEPGSRDCLQLHRVKDLASLPPILFIRLPPDWRGQTLYQSLVRLPGRRELRSKVNVAIFRWSKILSVWKSG